MTEQPLSIRLARAFDRYRPDPRDGIEALELINQVMDLEQQCANTRQKLHDAVTRLESLGVAL